MSRGGGVGLEDFSFYSEIFWEATLLVFSFPKFDLINQNLFGTHIGVDCKLHFHTQ